MKRNLMFLCFAIFCLPIVVSAQKAKNFGLKSDWLKYNDLLNKLEMGDLLECVVPGNPIISHWAVYLGNKYVIHRTGSLTGSFDAKAEIGTGVAEDLLSDVVDGRPCRINNALDETNNPFSPETIVDRAKEMTKPKTPEQREEIKGYNVLIKNCEHFATLCRYGEDISYQVRNTVGFVGAVAALAGAYNCFKDKDAPCNKLIAAFS